MDGEPSITLSRVDSLHTEDYGNLIVIQGVPILKEISQDTGRVKSFTIFVSGSEYMVEFDPPKFFNVDSREYLEYLSKYVKSCQELEEIRLSGSGSTDAKSV